MTTHLPAYIQLAHTFDRSLPPLLRDPNGETLSRRFTLSGQTTPTIPGKESPRVRRCRVGRRKRCFGVWSPPKGLSSQSPSVVPHPWSPVRQITVGRFEVDVVVSRTSVVLGPPFPTLSKLSETFLSILVWVFLSTSVSFRFPFSLSSPSFLF